MGTPEFAVPSLEALHRDGYPILCVITRPDRPRGRNRRRSPSPVKVVAEKQGDPVFQPESLRDTAVLEKIRALQPDLIVVVAFGALLPKALLECPSLGAINIHASLLPRYRGPAPISWAVINGDTETGVTAMQMDAGLDTGDILGALKTTIRPQDTAHTLQDRLARMGSRLLLSTLENLAAGTLKPIPQNPDQATYASMLQKHDGKIDWKMPAEIIERRIRGMMPWPGAFTVWNEKTLRIFRARVAAGDVPEPPGTVLESRDEIRVAAGNDVLVLLEVQAASGSRMPASAFLRGTRIPEGTVMH